MATKLMVYTKLHEKLLCSLITFMLVAKEFVKIILISAFLLSIAYLLAMRSHDAIFQIWLPVVLSTLFFIFIVPAFLFRTPTWPTIQKVDNDFYEEAIPGSSTFKPRPIEELYYTKGVWKTVSSNHIVRFRGVNLPAKTPTRGHDPAHFYSMKEDVTFVGAPFPLHEADQHFQRLSNYGYNLLRLVVTWEAVMHKGPGIIDYEYLDYLSKLVDKAAKFGLYIIIDPHQDVWSRFTGGDGAPWWTLDAAGFVTDDTTLHETGSAFVHHLHEPTPQDVSPKMIWMTNYGKLAAATMFTLFFAGDAYAPGINVGDLSAQQFLQKYYLEFLDKVAETVKDKLNVIGFNSMNEPSNGYVGIADLTIRTLPMPFGYSTSYFDGIRVGSGETIKCEHYNRPFLYHERKRLNPLGKLAWKSPDHDIWRKLGVYEIDAATGERRLLQPNYFKIEGDFIEMFMTPLFESIQRVITRHNKRFVLYAEPFIDVANHGILHAPESLDANKYAWAPHWYDGCTLIFLRFFPWLALDDVKEAPVLFKSNVAKVFKRNLGHISRTGNEKLHVVLGEFGVPFDMTSKNFEFSESTMALDRTMQAVEANDLDYTLWNYFPHNTISEGDQWNGEDLSIRMQSGNRALLAAVRPFVQKIPHEFKVSKQSFDPSKESKPYQLVITCNWREDYQSNGSCGGIFIYLPLFHFNRPKVSISGADNTSTHFDESRQILVWNGLLSDNCPDDAAFVLNVENEIHPTSYVPLTAMSP